MKLVIGLLAGILFITFGAAAQSDDPSSTLTSGTPRVMPAMQLDNPQTNLPWLPVGPGDMVGVTVADCPELTRAFRVADNGDINPPLLQSPLHVAGLKPPEIEQLIASALKEQHLLVRPSVSVGVMEYRSRPIKVVGAVVNPIEFQATADMTLLGALAKAQGLTDAAGPEIILTSQAPDKDGYRTGPVRRIPVRELLHGADPSLNLPLVGGEEIRVPEADKIYVIGNVKVPSALPLHDDTETTVLKVLAQCQGLAPYPSNNAYVYRFKPATKEREEISIPLKLIMKRKAPDVTLLANDVLYVPDATGKRLTMESLAKLGEIGGAAVSGLLIWGRL